MDRVWDKDAFWDTPKKNVLNCISEQEEGNKKIRQVHKLTESDPLFKECVDALTPEHIDKNTKERITRKFEEQKKQKELKESKERAKQMEILFNYKLKTFEVEEIKLSRNRELKSKLRRAKSIPEVNLWSIKILDDYLNSE
tara:strand:- start:163 stop:585 length:423 start_codon:yes stop_codon:yes gene_type:complete